MFCLLPFSFGYHGSSPGVFVSHPLTIFGKALELLRKHAEKDYHEEGVVRCEEFRKMMTHQQPDIISRLNQNIADNNCFQPEKNSAQSSKQ